MQHQESEGLVLRAIEYKQQQKILTLLTRNQGIIHLIAKGINQKKSHLFSLTTPFSIGEFHYTIHRSELYSLRDATLKNAHLELRTNLSYLQAAGQICNALIASQLPGKSAPLLYKLALSYLEQIPLFEDLSSLIPSFLLKILKHEGLLSSHQSCTHCESPPTHLSFGEPLCSSHAPYFAQKMEEKEWEPFFALLEVHRFSTLKVLALKSPLNEKIIRSFQERYPAWEKR
jgi:DNA repair protein RecO